MPQTRSPSRSRVIASTVGWALGLLLLVNVGWSCWFARYGVMDGELMRMLDSDSTGVSPGVSLDQSDADFLNLVYRRTLPDQTRYWIFRAPNENNVTAAAIKELRSKLMTSYEQLAPWWLRRRHFQFEGAVLEDADYAGEMSVVVGWPVRLLWCSWRRKGTEFYVARDTGLEFKPPGSPTPSGFLGLALQESYSRAFPFRPVLAGQLVYGMMCIGVVLLMRFGPRAARRWWRRRGGRCGECGYDLRGNTSGVCPECGGVARNARVESGERNDGA